MLLPQPLGCWGYRHVPPCMASFKFLKLFRGDLLILLHTDGRFCISPLQSSMLSILWLKEAESECPRNGSSWLGRWDNEGERAEQVAGDQAALKGFDRKGKVSGRLTYEDWTSESGQCCLSDLGGNTQRLGLTAALICRLCLNTTRLSLFLIGHTTGTLTICLWGRAWEKTI